MILWPTFPAQHHHPIMEEQVATSPDKIAVQRGATSLSYRDLDNHANHHSLAA